MGNVVDDIAMADDAAVVPGIVPVSVLLVDDMPQNLLALEAMLADLPLDLVRAESGEEALRRVLQEDFAVILLDVLMPGMDGLETAALIRGRERSRATPIIFVTAAGHDEELLTRGYALGAVDYIVKPIQPAILRSKVAVFVELFRTTAQVREQAEALARLNAELEERVRARTAELQAAQSVAEWERDLLRQVLDVLPEAVLITDANGRVVSSNAAAMEILGLDPAGCTLVMTGGDAHDLFGLRHLDGTQMSAQELPFQRSLDGAVVQSAQLLVRNARDGRDVPILVNSAPLHDAGGMLSGVVAVFQDISTLKSLERQREEFLSSVSHDLKNPLSTINGMVQVLQRRAARPGGVDAAQLRDGLETIRRTALQMVALLEELLDLTRLQMDRPLDLDLRPIDLVLLIERVVAAHQQATERHAIRFQYAGSTLEVTGDPARIERVLGNLLSNATKYSPAGGEIAVALSDEVAASGRWAVLEVRDHGIGIAADDLPRVFERFYRGRSVTSTMQGTGLGLASVRQIVEQHGGGVAAASNLEGGTTITVRLPLAGPNPDA